MVSDATVARVLAAAKELGYRPHPLARGLRTDRTLTVGIVVPDLENPLFPPLVRGAEAALGVEGYTLLIGNTDNEQEHTEAVISTLVERRVDGLILATAERGSGVAAAVQAEGIHVVLVNRESADGSVPAIVGDDDVGIGMAVDHLVELGHSAIGHVAGPPLLSTGFGRCEAFKRHMERHGLPLEGRVEVADWFQVGPGARATAALLSRNPELTAIVAGNDLLALGALRALHDADVSVPGDMSLTGYNDMPFVDLMQPPLTTVGLPYREMGAMAAKSLLARMRGDGDEPQVTRLRPTLRVRSSTESPR